MKQIIVSIVILVFMGCGAKKKEVTSSAKEKKEVVDKVPIHDNWKLIKMLDKDISKNIPIEFNKDSKFYGTDGCNNISGVITKLNDDTIVLGAVMSTRMACKDMKTPAQYQNLLKQVQQYKIEASNLYLLGADKKTLLVFKKID